MSFPPPRPHALLNPIIPGYFQTSYKDSFMSSKGLLHRAEHDPRAAALLVLQEVLTGQESSQSVLDRRIRSSKLVPSDKGLCTELVYGVLRRHLRLERFIRQMLPKPEKLPPEMLLILELAAYELAHTRIPKHASLSWPVTLLRNRFGPGMAKVGGGVLHRFERGLKTEYDNPEYYSRLAGFADHNPERPEFLAFWHALPLWIVELWINAYGLEEATAYMEASSQAAPFGLRVNLNRPGHKNLLEQLAAQEGASLVPPACMALRTSPRIAYRELYASGRITRQSPASYQALWELEPQSWPAPIWDACAGRGGKSSALLESGLEVAQVTDSSEKRLAELPPELERLGLAGKSPAVSGVSAQKAGFTGQFGTVLVDAPCSGLGTLSHRPEIRWRRSPEDLAKLVETQAAILDAAYAALKPGGKLVYLTCTVNPAENEDQVRALLERQPSLKVERQWRTPVSAALNEFFWGVVLGMDS